MLVAQMLQNDFQIGKSPPKPRMPRPTTPSPMTEPPEKATSRAFPKESLAAFAVRTLAFVANMPKYPASAEQNAPQKKLLQVHDYFHCWNRSSKAMQPHLQRILSNWYSAFIFSLLLPECLPHLTF